MVDPGRLVHQAACLRELCGALDLGQRPFRVVADEEVCLRARGAHGALPAAASARERLDLCPPLPRRLVVLLRAGGQELQRLELGVGVARAPRESESALGVSAGAVEVVPRAENGNAAQHE